MVVHGPFPPDPRVARQARVARELGWEVDVLATRQPGQPGLEFIEGVRVSRLPIRHRWGGSLVDSVREYVGFSVLASMWVAARSSRRRYDVVQIHNPPDFLILAALVPRMLGSRVLLDIHDLAPEMFAMRFGARAGARAADRVLRLIERAAGRLADAVVTVHDPYRRELIARGMSQPKITVVMNSVDEHLLDLSEGCPPTDGFRVVYQGTLTPHYGVELLLDAAARAAEDIPELRLEIYGDGDALPGIRSRAIEIGFTERLYLSGRFLPHEQVLGEVRSASVGVIPNLLTPMNEFALSTKLFEFVVLGVPVVAADLPTLREHFGDEELLFFEPGNVEALSGALREVQANPGAAAARAQAARRRYAEYSWAKHGARYGDILAGLSGDPGRRASTGSAPA